MRGRLARIAWALLPALLWSVGCGPPAIKFPDTVPFGGNVTMDGAPLANASVVFTPASGTGASATGITDAEGKYELSVSFGTEQKPGAVPADYNVRISSMLPPPPPDKKAAPPGLAATVEKIPEQYSSPLRTTLKATVGPNGGSKDFELKSR